MYRHKLTIVASFFRILINLLMILVIVGCASAPNTSVSSPSNATIIPLAPVQSTNTTPLLTPIQSTEIALTSIPLQPTEITTKPTQQPPPKLMLIPFNYVIQDAGEGWNDVTVSIASENTGDPAVSPLCLITRVGLTQMDTDFLNQHCLDARRVTINTTEVETREGKTYTASDGWGFNGVQFNNPKIPSPPGFPFDTGVKVTFRVAKAAHPIRLVIKPASDQDYPDIFISLENISNEIPAPDLSHYQVKPISDLANLPLLDVPGKLKVAFSGNCFHGSVSGFSDKATHLPYSIINANQLDEEKDNVDFYLISYYPSGILEYQYISFGDREVKAGPGQTVSLEVLLFDVRNGTVLDSEKKPPSYFILYDEDNKHWDIYKLDCPER
jgi:hypothetical protein